MKRWLVCAIGCAACRGELARPAGEPVRTVALTRGDIVDRQLLTGEVRAASALGLTVPRTDTWQLTIRWIADDGAPVKAGDRVLEFDNSTFTAQLAEKHLAVLEAEMALRAAQDLGAIETESKATAVRQHQIALDKAGVRAGVPADLLAGRDAQERQLEKRRAEVAFDKSAHDLAAQRDEAALELRVKQIDLDKTRNAIAAAEKTIADLVLIAPRDGVLVVEDHPWQGRKFRAGDFALPGMTVASLPALDQAMEVRAELSDVDDGRVAAGMAGRCTLDAYPGDPVPCTIKAVTPVARSKGETSLRRGFTVELAVGTTEATRMRPGMSVKVELDPRRVPNAVIVPRGAILAAEPGGPGHVRVRLASGESGVAAGDVVAVGGAP